MRDRGWRSRECDCRFFAACVFRPRTTGEGSFAGSVPALRKYSLSDLPITRPRLTLLSSRVLRLAEHHPHHPVHRRQRVFEPPAEGFLALDIRHEIAVRVIAGGEVDQMPAVLLADRYRLERILGERQRGFVEQRI